MNIYEKIQLIKSELLKANLKKTGENKYAGFKYYELADILPTIIQKCNEHKLFTRVTFDNNEALLEIVNIENPEEKIIYTSPMEELELKGCNKIQALGGTETYSRRYLYMACFDIVENDMFDGHDPLTKETAEQYAKEFTFKTGKHIDWTLERVIKEDKKFLNWLVNNSTDERLLEAIKLLTGKEKKTDEEWDKRLELTEKIQRLIVDKGLDIEKICEYYKVDSTMDLTEEQMKEIIEKRS